MHPTGLSKDGVSTVYKRFEVKAGTYRLAVKMNDNLVINRDFNFVKEEQVTLKPAQVLVVDFNPDKGGLFFQQAAAK
jgi:outer membrane usher protein FimD/PapC